MWKGYDLLVIQLCRWMSKSFGNINAKSMKRAHTLLSIWVWHLIKQAGKIIGASLKIQKNTVPATSLVTVCLKILVNKSGVGCSTSTYRCDGQVSMKMWPFSLYTQYIAGNTLWLKKTISSYFEIKSFVLLHHSTSLFNYYYFMPWITALLMFNTITLFQVTKGVKLCINRSSFDWSSGQINGFYLSSLSKNWPINTYKSMANTSRNKSIQNDLI